MSRNNTSEIELLSESDKDMLSKDEKIFIQEATIQDLLYAVGVLENQVDKLREELKNMSEKN